MKKLSPFRIGCTRRCFFGLRGVNKLKHKGSPGNNPLTAWKKVSSDYPKNIKDIRCWELDKRKQHTFPRHSICLLTDCQPFISFSSWCRRIRPFILKNNTYHNQLRHVKLPTFINVKILYIVELVILHTKIAERILQFIDEIYQVLVHLYALDRYSNRERSSTLDGLGSTRWKPWLDSIRQLYLFLLFFDAVLLRWALGRRCRNSWQNSGSGFLCTHYPYISHNTREPMLSNHHIDWCWQTYDLLRASGSLIVSVWVRAGSKWLNIQDKDYATLSFEW